MSVSSDWYNLDQDNTLGGDNPSISKVSSQKAIKEALDTKQDVLTAGKSISIENSDGYNWIDYTVTQQEFGFNKVIFDGEKFVALTSNGIATSTDGATWTEITLEINVYNDIAYGNGKYVMVGDMGYIATSTNGTTWVENRHQIQDDREYKYPDFQCVAFGNNQFVALSSKMSTMMAGDTFAYAKGDGAGSFTLGFMGNDSYADDYKDIAYGNSGFVAVGAYSYIAKYNNSWDEYNIDGDYEIDGSYELKNVLYANGHYITPCYQGIFSSTNGTAWSFDETSVLSSDIKDSIYVNDTYLYLDDYALHVSSDLENWQNFNYSEDLGGNEVINSLAFGNGKLIIVGDEGTVITIDYFAGTRINCVVDSQLSSTSENPVQNSVVYNALMSKQNNLTAGNSISISGSGFDFANPTANQPYQTSWHDITFDGENFILVGGYTIGITSDGVTLNDYNTTGDYNSIVYANNIYVTVGYNGYIATSTDSTTWTERHISFNNGGSTEYPDWKKVAYGNGMFLAISDYVFSNYSDGFVMATSSDGVTWTTSFVQTEEYGSNATIFYGLATNGSDFVAVGDYMAEAVYSNSSWYMAQIELTYDTLKTIMYDGSSYIVPTSSGVYTSTDGSTWTLIENNSMGSDHIYAGYYGGKYVLLSDYSTWYVSDNLSTWQEYNFSSLMGGNEMSTAMAFGNDMILSVGDEGTIVSIPYLTGSATINCVVDSQLSSTSINPVQNSTIYNALDGKQATLVSGQTIKTINNSSILGSGNLTVTASAPSNMVTTDTTQNITGEKTFVGDKRIKFKQSTSTNNLGFTLYDNNNAEKGYLEYNPSNKIDNAPLMTLGNYATAAGNITQVGFRRYSGVSGANGAYNLLTPLIADAKTPFSLTTTYSNFYMPLGFKNGSTQVLTAKSGVADLSSLFPTIATSVSSTSTNAETVGAKLFYDTVGNIETLINAL